MGMENLLAGRQEEPKSWAEAIQSYQRSKKSLPWVPEDLLPQTYVKQYDVSRKSREVDPVLMRHRNPEEEALRVKREEERLRVTLTKAKNRQLKFGQDYDIVSHRSYLEGLESKTQVLLGEVLRAKYTKHPDTRSRYNILNHVPQKNALSLKLIYPEGETPEVLPQKDVVITGGKKPYSHNQRDVDILSNRYNQEHSKRMEEEKQQMQEHAAEKYRMTHDFNIIVGTYYDQEKERNFLRTREELEKIQGQAQRHRLPPTIRLREGQVFDIISKEVRDPGKVQDLEGVADRSVCKRARGRDFHEQSVRSRDEDAARWEERALNRPSHQRHAERLRAGHDPINNLPFTGREGQPPPKPRACPPVPVWGRLHHRRRGGEAGVGEASARETRVGIAGEAGVVVRSGSRGDCKQESSRGCGGGGVGGGDGGPVVPPLDLRSETSVRTGGLRV